ncbi:MAG: STAS domain-containing protein [Planctomycetota bacterium]|jgi:anti-anti-sigma factor
MELERREDGDVTFLTLRGQFETFSLPTISEEMEHLIDDGARRVCMNFHGVSFINSTALGYLVAVGKRLKDLGGELVFSSPSRFFADTIRTLELHHLFEIFASDQEAALYFVTGTT